MTSASVVSGERVRLPERHLHQNGREVWPRFTKGKETVASRLSGFALSGASHPESVGTFNPSSTALCCMWAVPIFFLGCFGHIGVCFHCVSGAHNMHARALKTLRICDTPENGEVVLGCCRKRWSLVGWGHQQTFVPKSSVESPWPEQTRSVVQLRVALVCLISSQWLCYQPGNLCFCGQGQPTSSLKLKCG